MDGIGNRLLPVRDVGPTAQGGSMHSRVGFDVWQVNINIHTGGQQCLSTDTKLLYVYTKMSTKDLELSLRDSQSLHLWPPVTHFTLALQYWLYPNWLFTLPCVLCWTSLTGFDAQVSLSLSSRTRQAVSVEPTGSLYCSKASPVRWSKPKDPPTPKVRILSQSAWPVGKDKEPL